MLGIFMADRTAVFKPGPNRRGGKKKIQNMDHLGFEFLEPFVKGFSNLIGQIEPHPPRADQAFAKSVAADQQHQI